MAEIAASCGRSRLLDQRIDVLARNGLLPDEVVKPSMAKSEAHGATLTHALLP